MMLEHGAIDGAEEPLGLGVERIAFRVAGAMSSHRAGFDPAMRTRGTVALLLAFDNLIQAAWHLRCQRDLIDAVAVALEQACRMAVQAKDLVTVRRLHDAHQRLGMEAVGDDRQIRNGTLQAVDAEQARCAEHGQALEVVVPEVRSEEHTSELQSLMRISYAVFCLKKKT